MFKFLHLDHQNRFRDQRILKLNTLTQNRPSLTHSEFNESKCPEIIKNKVTLELK